MSTLWLLHAQDLKQWVYCPRIVYFNYFMPSLRPETYLMEEGRLAHEEEELREVRRSLRRYGLEEAERHLRVELADEGLGVSGRVDLVLRLTDETIPVEYKLNTASYLPNHRIQLAIYAMLLEANEWPAVRRGFLYSIRIRQAEEVKMTTRLREQARSVVEEIRAMIAAERMPEPAAQRAKCVNCEFRRFCNDVS
ncbi:MAG: CRISPR-associated protein Cas4 [Anaerolineae bacterium]|nr:CRISPR-associated protein Cas4 [Anaerolineae bacterium]MDW8098623.1 CRISPR-associated protein Cas4 [Anaerolineae bacterium]